MSQTGFDQSRGYEPSPRGYGESAPRSRDDQRTERIPAARRSGRYQDTPEPGHAGRRPGIAGRHRAAARRGRNRYRAREPALRHRALWCGPHGHDASAPTRTWRTRTCSPGYARKSRRPRPSRGRRTSPRGAGGRRVAGTTTMTMTGRARSGTSSPTSSTGRNCPPTSRSRPRPAAAQPSAPAPAATPAKTIPHHHPACGVRARRIPAPAGTGRRARGPGPPPPACRPSRADGQPSGHAPADGLRGHRSWAPRSGRAARARGVHERFGPPPARRASPAAPPAPHRNCPPPPSLRRPGSMTTR